MYETMDLVRTTTPAVPRRRNGKLDWTRNERKQPVEQRNCRSVLEEVRKKRREEKAQKWYEVMEDVKNIHSQAFNRPGKTRCRRLNWKLWRETKRNAWNTLHDQYDELVSTVELING